MNTNIIPEKWKLIYCFNTKISDFAISNYGRVMNITSGKIISQRYDEKGYRIITIYIDHTRQYRVHRLVAMHFIPNPKLKPVVNHIDGNKNNNCVWNLEWCTAKENMRHAVDTGLHPTLMMESSPHAMHTNEKINNVCKFMIENPEFKLKDVSSIFNIGYATLQNLKLHRSWVKISSKYDFKSTEKTKNLKIKKNIVSMLLSGYTEKYLIDNFSSRNISLKEYINMIDESVRKLKSLSLI